MRLLDALADTVFDELAEPDDLRLVVGGVVERADAEIVLTTLGEEEADRLGLTVESVVDEGTPVGKGVSRAVRDGVWLCEFDGDDDAEGCPERVAVTDADGLLFTVAELDPSSDGDTELVGLIVSDALSDASGELDRLALDVELELRSGDAEVAGDAEVDGVTLRDDVGERVRRTLLLSRGEFDVVGDRVMVRLTVGERLERGDREYDIDTLALAVKDADAATVDVDTSDGEDTAVIVAVELTEREADFLDDALTQDEGADDAVSDTVELGERE